jgi:hypothetical protein
LYALYTSSLLTGSSGYKSFFIKDKSIFRFSLKARRDCRSHAGVWKKQKYLCLYLFFHLMLRLGICGAFNSAPSVSLYIPPPSPTQYSTPPRHSRLASK